MRSLLAKAVVVVAITLLAGAAAYAFSKEQARSFTAVAQLGYGRALTPELQAMGPAFAEPAIDASTMATEANRVNSFDVAVETAKDAPGLKLDANAIAARVDVGQPHDTHTVLVTATGVTPEEAARLGSAYVDAYVKMSRDRQVARAVQIQKALRYRYNHLSRPSTLGPLGATLRDEISLAGTLQKVGTGGPQVIQHARASGVQTQPQTKRNVLFGLLFGLVAGIGVVALRSEARNRGGVAAARRVSGAQ